MDAVWERGTDAPPAVYEQWLQYFDLLSRGCTADSAVLDYIARGTFSGGGFIKAQFEQRLVSTVNAMLSNRISRFLKDLNLLLALGEPADIAPLFIKLRRAANDCMFFTGLDFLSAELRSGLADAIHIQMREFWNDTVAFLRGQALESGSRELEDSLYFIGRLSLSADRLSSAGEGM